MANDTADSRESLINQLKLLIIEECDKDVSPEDIDNEETLINGTLELDSLDALQICMAVKNHYGVQINGGPDARKALSSVTSLANTILERQPA